MTVPWRKAIRDFWDERTRTALVVLAVAVGISGLATVLATYAILERELDRGYLATNPASAILRTDVVDDALIAAVKASPGVADVEARRVIRGRIRGRSGDWRGLTLFVVKHFGNIRIGRVSRENGAWPPGPGEMLMERDAFQVIHARIGDSVTVKSAHGVERSWRVAGSVHDVGQAQARMENAVYGYVTIDSLAALGESPFFDELGIVVAGNRFDERHVLAVAADVERLVEARGHPVRRLDVPKPGRHPHADIMGLLLLGMAAFGFGVLLLSGILVVNLLVALMASQIRQIGVMKTLGASRLQIAAIYLGQTLLLGLAAIALSVPVAVAGCRVFTRALAVLLNFDVTSFAVPAWVYLLVAGVGIVVPLGSGFYPVWKGSSISIREALADSGVSRSRFGIGPFDRAVSRIGGSSRPLLLAIRNSFRRRGRLLRTLATLTAAGLFFLSALNLRTSMIFALDRLFETKKFDVTVGLSQITDSAAAERVVRAVPGVRDVESWITTEGTIPSASSVTTPTRRAARPPLVGRLGGVREHGAGGVAGDRFVAIALPPGTRFQEFRIIEGRALAAGDANAVVVNGAMAAKLPGLRVGSEVSLQIGHVPMTWRVVGVAREPFSPPTAYVSLSHLRQLGGLDGVTNGLRVVLDEKGRASIRRVLTALEERLEESGVRVAGTLSKADSRYGFDQHMVMIYVSLVVMSCILGAVGGLGLMTTMTLNALERRREMGVLRAIGATPGILVAIVVGEGAVVGLMSWALAALAAWPVGRLISDVLLRRAFQSAIEVRFDRFGIAVWAVVSLTVGAAASLLPAWQASRRPVREALEYQ